MCIFWHVEMMMLEPQCNRSLVICNDYFGNGERTEWSRIRIGNHMIKYERAYHNQAEAKRAHQVQK